MTDMHLPHAPRHAGRPPRYASIDVGTNSIKLHVGERAAAGTWRTVADRAEVTRLGEGLAEHRRISEAALERALGAIAAMAAEAKDLGAVTIVAVGTAGLRTAANGAAVVEAIRARTGVEVAVIPGEDEARLAYVATRGTLREVPDRLVVVDTGGGSTQFTFGRGSDVAERFSVPVGAVGYTERFGLGGVVTPDTLRELFGTIAADLSRIDGRAAPDAMVAIGGAATNLAAVKHGLRRYDPERVQGTVLDRAELDRQIELYRSRDAAARRGIAGLQPGRADVILAGACILRTVMEKLATLELTVSDRGLRHGVLAERFGL
jgi:exopolyphosphatase/guanosine-5'-triphosphate,3'-diphosphate pyrophosphatase